MKKLIDHSSFYVVISLIMLTFSGCNSTNTNKPSVCDCKTVLFEAVGDEMLKDRREAMIRINGEEYSTNYDAVKKCKKAFKDEFSDWKKTHDPNRSWSDDWEKYFYEKCK